MTYTVVELTKDGSFFDTSYKHISKDTADNIVKKLNATELNGSEYFAQKDEQQYLTITRNVLQYKQKEREDKNMTYTLKVTVKTTGTTYTCGWKVATKKEAQTIAKAWRKRDKDIKVSVVTVE